MLSERPKEAIFLLCNTPLARMTKGSLNCRHKGWGRERKGQDQSGVVAILPSQQRTLGMRAVCVYMEQCVHGTAVNCLRARKEINTAAKGWPAFVSELSFVLRGSPS